MFNVSSGELEENVIPYSRDGVRLANLASPETSMHDFVHTCNRHTDAFGLITHDWNLLLRLILQ